jgi:tyrosinase
MRTMLSPLDPLFWLHHCNVDRIQESWRRQGNAYPANPLFADFMLRGFVSPAGGTYRRSVRNALSLGYTYDRYDPAPAVDAVLMASASGGTVARGATPSAVARDGSAAPGQPGRPGQPGQPGRSFRAVQVAPAALGMPGTTTVDVQGTVLPPEARVRLLDILPPAVPDAPFVRVFANNPAISPDTPPEGPTYLGTVSFFGSPAQHDELHDGHHPGEMGRFSFGLMLDGAAAAVPPGAPLQVQVVPVALDQPVQQVVVQPAAIEVVVPAS